MPVADQRRLRYAVVRCPEGACGEESGVLVEGYSGQQQLAQHCLVRHNHTVEGFTAITKSRAVHRRIVLQKSRKVPVARDCFELDLKQMQDLADMHPTLTICKGCFQPEQEFSGHIWRNVFIGLTDDIKHAHTSNNKGHGFGAGRSVLLLKAAIAESIKCGYNIRNAISSQVAYKLVPPDKPKARHDRHTNLHVTDGDDTSDVAPGPQRAAAIRVAIDLAISADATTDAAHVGVDASDAGSHDISSSSHIGTHGDSEGDVTKSNEYVGGREGKRKGAAINSDHDVGAGRKKQRIAIVEQAQHNTQATKPPDQQTTEQAQHSPLTPPQSADSDVVQGCMALLALRTATADMGLVDSDAICDSNVDALGFFEGDYDLMMSKARNLCTSKIAAEQQTLTQENQVLLESSRQIQDHLDNCENIHTQGLLSTICFNGVRSELSTKLEVIRQQLVSTQLAIDSLKFEDPKHVDTEALKCVLKIVAEGCVKHRR